MSDAPDESEDADEQDLVDRDKIDFDPDDGLYSGTAVDGTSDIPGPHEGENDGEGEGEAKTDGAGSDSAENADADAKADTDAKAD